MYSYTHPKHTHILIQDILMYTYPKYTHILYQQYSYTYPISNHIVLIQGAHFWGTVDASGQPQPRPQVMKSKPQNSSNLRSTRFCLFLIPLICSFVQDQIFTCQTGPILLHCQAFTGLPSYIFTTTIIHISQLHR